MNRPGRAIARTVRGILLGTVLAVVPTVTYALGLGALQVKSALNEPLNAEIDFTSISKKELQKLSVTLASRRDFDAAGVDRPPYLADVKFALSKRLDGQPFLQLTSEQPIREPFLHFLVQVEWAGGRLVREFTALIDPPTLFAGAAPAVQVPEQAPLPAPIAQPEAVPEPAPVIAAAPPAETLPPLAPEPPAPGPAVIEPLTAVATAEPAVTAMTPAEAALPPPTTSDEPLGPPRLGDSSVAISAETGWPLASTGPAELVAASDAPAVEPIVPAPLASAAPAMEPTTPASMAAPMPAPMPVAGGWANVTRYEVKRGDTLWAIAQKIRVDPTLSLEQVIMALYEVNRDAFFKNNVNNVWAGEVLLIPQREEVETLSTGQARQVFFAQYSEWQEYKLKLASASRTFKVAAAPEQSAIPAESGVGTPEASAQPEPATKPAEASAAPAAPKPEASKKPQQVDKPVKPEKAEPKPAPAPPTEQAVAPPKGAEAPVVAVRPKPPADLLKIVRAAIDSEAGAKGKVAEAEAGDTTQKERLALADRATTLDEAMQSKQLEQKEMQERIGTHQSQIEKQERLIELSNKDAVKTKDALTQPEPQAAAPVETAKGPEAKAPAEQAKPQDTAKAAPPPKAKPAAPADKPATPAAKKRRVAPPPTPPAEEKGIFAQAQEMFGSYVMQAVAAVVALAGGLILLTYLRRRRAAEAEFEESILTDTDAMTEGGTTDSGSAQTSSSAASTSFLSDFSQGGMGNISTDEVDPLAETEVYLAYGRDEQAEEILKDAVAKDPKRHELKVKLLEIYAQRKDMAAFETLAEELYAAQAGRGGDLWNRVADMGRKLNPGNPMFQAVAPPDEPSLPRSIPSAPRGAPAPAASASDVLDFEPPTDRGGAGEAESVPSFEVDTEDLKEASSGLDFELDLEGPEPKAKSVADGPVIPDTAELSAEELQVGQEDSLGLGDEPAESALDFDMGTEDRSGEEQEITADQPGEEPSWDVGADAEAGLALETEAEASVSTDDSQQWDETATKLDLAKAYVDMGDAEGARSILDEVLAEGNDEQKRQAAELAAQIA